MPRRAALLLALTLAACGTSDSGSSARPIEILYYVTGATGQPFEVVSEPEGCALGANVYSGIQSPNANHQLGTRVFETPYLFVLENTRQPIRAAFRNLSAAPITVNLYLGGTQAVGSPGIIPPGECRVVESDDTSGITVRARGPETQIEVCSPDAGLSTSCLDSQTSTDRNLFFFASLGDIATTSITNCVLFPLLDNCQTPATFFLQNPEQLVAAVMSVNPGQNAPNQPQARVRVELYLNGRLVDSDSDTEAVVERDL